VKKHSHEERAHYVVRSEEVLSLRADSYCEPRAEEEAPKMCPTGEEEKKRKRRRREGDKERRKNKKKMHRHTHQPNKIRNQKMRKKKKKNNTHNSSKRKEKKKRQKIRGLSHHTVHVPVLSCYPVHWPPY
jgi:hypothetical protein